MGLRQAILNKDWDQVRRLIEMAGNHHDAEYIVNTILTDEFFDGYVKNKLLGRNETPHELLDLALEKFCDTDSVWDHGSWTHSLSHFIQLLWKKEMNSWVRRFNEQAFIVGEKNRAKGFFCCDRLVYLLLELGGWNANPADFAITPERIDLAIPEGGMWADLAKSLPYASERDYQVAELRWPLDHPEDEIYAARFDFDGEDISWESVDNKLANLIELGEDVSMYDSLKPAMLRISIRKREKHKREVAGWDFLDLEEIRERQLNCQSEIDKLQVALEEMTQS